jgi:hypothetical protein
MKTRGVKVFDPILETVQLDWLVIPAAGCRDIAAEQHVVGKYFRKPHEPWGPTRAFVMPVKVRRGRCRVLFSQESGLAGH